MLMGEWGICMKFNNDFYEEDTNSGPNMTVIYMVLIMSTVILGVLAIVLWANKGMNHNNGSGYAKALAQKQEREQQTMITEGEVPAAASAGDTLTSGNLTSDQLDIWTLPDTGREKQTASSGRNNGTVTNQTTGEVVIGGSDSKDENTKTATADELAKGKTSVYDMTEKENLKEDEKASKDSKKDDDKETKDDEEDKEDDEDRIQITHSDGSKEWVDIDEDIKKNTYDFSNLKYQEPIMRYYVDGKVASCFGVDISSNLGDIDFEKLKNAGCEFCMIKIGSRGYSSGNIVFDEKYKDYLSGAKKAGLNIGVYFCSQAVSKNEAREEAEELIAAIEDYPVKYPVAFVMESIEDDMAGIEMLDTEERTKIAKAFMDEVKDAGYMPVLYGDKEWLLTMLDMEELEKYDVWYAQDGNKPDYPYEFKMWQYKSEGKVNGISQNVPLIMSFTDYSKK